MDVERADAALSSLQSYGTAQRGRLEELDARRKEIVKEAARLSQQKKLEQRKRKRLAGRMGSLSQADLVAIVGDVLAARAAKAKAKPAGHRRNGRGENKHVCLVQWLVQCACVE